MLKPVFWNENNQPTNTSIDDMLYNMRAEDKGNELILDPVTIADLHENADEIMALDALIVEFGKMDLKMKQFGLALDRASAEIKTVAYQTTEPMKKSGRTMIATIYELSDGQTVTVFFHNPDTTPTKLTPKDDMVSFKWLLNKKNITVLVAPENGKDLPIQKVAGRIMALAEKNSATFARQFAKRSAAMQEIKDLKGQISDADKTLESKKKAIELAEMARDEALAAPTPETTPEPEPEPELVKKFTIKRLNTFNPTFKTDDVNWFFIDENGDKVNYIQAIHEEKFSYKNFGSIATGIFRTVESAINAAKQDFERKFGQVEFTNEADMIEYYNKDSTPEPEPEPEAKTQKVIDVKFVNDNPAFSDYRMVFSDPENGKELALIEHDESNEKQPYLYHSLNGVTLRNYSDLSMAANDLLGDFHRKFGKTVMNGWPEAMAEFKKWDGMSDSERLAIINKDTEIEPTSYEQKLADLEKASNGDIYDSGYGGWANEATETSDTIAQFIEASKTTWLEASKPIQGVYAGIPFISWSNMQAKKGQQRDSLTVFDFGDKRVAVSIDMSNYIHSEIKPDLEPTVAPTPKPEQSETYGLDKAEFDDILKFVEDTVQTAKTIDPKEAEDFSNSAIERLTEIYEKYEGKNDEFLSKHVEPALDAVTTLIQSIIEITKEAINVA